MLSAKHPPQKPLFRAIPLFAGLEPDACALIEAGAVLKSFPKGAIVVTQGDEAHAMYLVLAGRLRVYRTQDEGREVLLGDLTTGDYFGELALLDPAPRSASVMVLQPARLAILSRDHLLRCLDQQPELARNLLASLAARFRALTVWVSDLASLDVYGRVARFLLDHAHEEDGERLTEPMTQQEIAHYVGASREMVSRIFKELRAGGYISLRGHQVVIHRRLPERW
jgi:CRP/FNR family cyclic AMP-dependent transcriptional regulator